MVKGFAFEAVFFFFFLVHSTNDQRIIKCDSESSLCNTKQVELGPNFFAHHLGSVVRFMSVFGLFLVTQGAGMALSLLACFSNWLKRIPPTAWEGFCKTWGCALFPVQLISQSTPASALLENPSVLRLQPRPLPPHTQGLVYSGVLLRKRDTNVITCAN